MVYIGEEGKFNENTYLIDANFMKLPHTLSLYVVEHNGARMLIDVGETLGARKLVKKLESLNLTPIHKILFTHAHWDHIQALPRILKYLGDSEIEILAHQNALDVLKNPEEMNAFFEYPVEPIMGVTPLKKNDKIDLNGFELRVIEFFGHTQDSIALMDATNKNIIVGDAIIDHIDLETYTPVLYGPHFDENSLFKTYEKLNGMKDKLESISLAHFGVYTGVDFTNLVENVKEKYLTAKESLVKWYNENPDPLYVTKKYQENIIPDSKSLPKENLGGIQWFIEQHIHCLKAAGFIK